MDTGVAFSAYRLRVTEVSVGRPRIRLNSVVSGDTDDGEVLPGNAFGVWLPVVCLTRRVFSVGAVGEVAVSVEPGAWFV